MTKITAKCDLCDSSFPFGHGRYDRKVLPHYQMTLCMSCYEGNWDGISPYREKRFEEHLKSRGIPLSSRNAKSLNDNPVMRRGSVRGACR
jgi:hypothetical protein